MSFSLLRIRLLRRSGSQQPFVTAEVIGTLDRTIASEKASESPTNGRLSLIQNT